MKAEKLDHRRQRPRRRVLCRAIWRARLDFLATLTGQEDDTLDLSNCNRAQLRSYARAMRRRNDGHVKTFASAPTGRRDAAQKPAERKPTDLTDEAILAKLWGAA